jgi:hypothetical protein
MIYFCYFKRILFFPLFVLPILSFSQQWQNMDSIYQPLPASVHIFFTSQPIDTAPFRAYYLVADMKDRKLEFSTDTVRDRRLTPSQFYIKDASPVAVVNCTFFSFETNRSLNTVVKNGRLVAFNQATFPGKGRDTLMYRHTLGSAIGLKRGGRADVAWLYTDSASHQVYASQVPPVLIKDSSRAYTLERARALLPGTNISKWKMKTAVGGGPVLIQDGRISITNNEEWKFPGKGINDKHPRTAMGYTSNGKLIILVVEGRNKVAHGATLTQEAQILKDLGCIKALNLDGGGSSCLLVNGRPTIHVSDSAGQRPVPAVFLIRNKRLK